MVPGYTALNTPIMRTLGRSALLFASLLPLTSCYTQLASDKGDYYGYTGTRHREVIVEKPVRSDTTVIVREQPAVAAKPPVSDKTDTVYVDDNRSRTEYATNDAQSTTIINNYYDNSYAYPSPYYGTWYPHHYSGIAIVIGTPYPWPVYDYYRPWYWSSWYDPYDYWGHGYWRNGGLYAYDPYYPYPPSPFYNCYAPIYSPDPYWYHRHGYRNDEGGYYGSSDRGSSNSHTGRIRGGERRAASTTTTGSGSTTTTGSGSTTTTGSGSSRTVVSREASQTSKPELAANTTRATELSSSRATTVNEVSAGEAEAVQGGSPDLRAGDRNAPVHAVSPAVVSTGSAVSNSNATSPASGNAASVADGNAATRTTGSQPSAQPTRSTTYVDPSTGHHVVVIHRSAPASGSSTYGGQVSRAGSTQQSGRSQGSERAYTPRRGQSTEGAPQSTRATERASERTESDAGSTQVVERPAREDAGSRSESSGRYSGGNSSNGSNTSGGGNAGGGNSGGGNSGGGRSESSHGGGGRAR